MILKKTQKVQWIQLATSQVTVRMKSQVPGTQTGPSTDTEEIIERIEREVKAAPIPIARRGMTTEDLDDEMTAGPSSAWPVPPSTLKLGFE